MSRKSKGGKRFETEVSGGKYAIEGVLGEGGFCVVFKGIITETNEIVAIKRMDKTKPLYKKFTNSDAMERLNQLMYREAEVMRALNHKNLMKIVDFIDTGVHIYLMLEMALGGEVYDKLIDKGRFSEEQSATIIHQVIEGLKYMHNVGFVHRDIKAENILFRNKESYDIIISDFGLSKHFLHTLHTNCGTLVYSAPELLKNKTSKKGYTNKVDNWAVGVLLYLLLCGYLPFDDPKFNESRITQKILKSRPLFFKAPWNSIHDSAQRLILGLLERDPVRRMELEQASVHPFLKMHLYGEIVNESPKPEPKIVPNCQKIRLAILYIAAALYIDTNSS